MFYKTLIDHLTEVLKCSQENLVARLQKQKNRDIAVKSIYELKIFGPSLIDKMVQIHPLRFTARPVNELSLKIRLYNGEYAYSRPIVDHYENEYLYRIQYPDLPCLESQKGVLYPIECVILWNEF